MQGILNNRFIAFLKLVRIENLVMIALTQYLMRYFVLEKILDSYGMEPGLDEGLFSLLVASTVLIAAAGYIINDYFDLKTDLINHPDTVVIDRAIKRRWAIILHIAFTLAGIVLGMYCALKTGYLRLAIFHFTAAALLWFYSTHFKKQLLVGNIVVSLLTASVAFIPLVYEIGVMEKHQPGFSATHTSLVLSCFKAVFIFSLFAFITSMAREIIKDMEDYEGDSRTGGHTLPIYWGIHAGKITAFFLLLITSILLTVVVYNSFRHYRVLFSFNHLYILLGLILPLAGLKVMLVRAKRSSDFKIASLVLKFIMLTGLAYGIVFYYK